MKTYLVNNRVIPLGIQGENEARRFAFSFPDYADYNIVVTFLRPGAQMAYAPVVVHDGEMVYWTATDIDTAISGEGCAVFNFYLNDELRKSLTYDVRIAPDPTASIGPQPDDFEAWYRSLLELQLLSQNAAEEAQESAKNATQSALAAAFSADAAADAAAAANSSAGTASTAASNAKLSERAAKSAQSEAQAAAVSANQNAVASEQAANNAQNAQNEAEKAAGEIKGITASAESLPTGSSATAAYDPATGNLLFGIPAGTPGAPGNPGKTPVKGVDYLTPSEVDDIANEAARKVPAPDLMPYAKNADLAAEVTRATNAERQLSEGLNQLNEDIVDLENSKIDKPTDAPSVGKILKVKSANADGSFVVEWADAPTGAVEDVQINGTSILADGVANVPKATANDLGVAAFGSGFYINPLGKIIVNKAANSEIDSRKTGTVITSDNLDYAVKTAMCDGKGADWTADEQAAARARMGVPSLADVELVADITLEEDLTNVDIDMLKKRKVVYVSIDWSNCASRTGTMYYYLNLGDDFSNVGVMTGQLVEPTTKYTHSYVFIGENSSAFHAKSSSIGNEHVSTLYNSFLRNNLASKAGRRYLRISKYGMDLPKSAHIKIFAV